MADLQRGSGPGCLSLFLLIAKTSALCCCFLFHISGTRGSLAGGGGNPRVQKETQVSFENKKQGRGNSLLTGRVYFGGLWREG